MEGDLEQASMKAGRPAAMVQAKINVAPTTAVMERRERTQEFSTNSALIYKAYV